MAPVYASGGQYVTVGQGVGGQVSGGGGGIGSWLFSLFYQRYADSHTEAITYTGPGQGNIESRLVEVGAGQGSYMAKRTPTYSYRPRYCVICCCGFFGLSSILIPLLMLCEVQRFFGLTDTCGSYNDVCENNCASSADAYNMKPYCCASCPFQVQNNGLQCEAPHSPPEIHTVVRRHYNTIYRKVPVNHYVKVQMPQQPPLVHTVKVVTPPKEYDCEGMDGHPNPVWSGAHTRWCCYKYKEYCPHTVVDKDYYHTVTKVQHIKVPVPEPMPTHAPIVHTIHHRYHVPSPPKYVKVHVPGPTVVKPVVVHDRVPVPVKEPPQVINVKKPYTVHVKGRDHYVKVPVPSPPHVVTHYHTHWNTVIDHSYDCQNGLSDWHHLWSHSKRAWCCSHHNSGCSHHNSGHWSHQMSHHNSGHWVKKVHVVQTYDCHAGFDNWYHGWSDGKKSWCCEKKTMGCPGSWHHGHWHHSHHAVVIHEEHVGHGGYDCHAGASNWMQGWSGKKKDWCCSKGHNQFCVKFHCHAEHAKVNAWSSEQRDFCCSNFQMGCPHTTSSPSGCDAMCVVNGESSSCKSRMKWTQHNVFGGKSNACNLAYSKIQMECDVCRACSIEAAGCGAQGPGKAAFDCHPASGNWSGAATRSRKAASPSTPHPTVMSASAKFGRKCSSVATGLGRRKWPVARFPCISPFLAMQACQIGASAGHLPRSLGAVLTSSSAASASSTTGSVSGLSNTLWSLTTTSSAAVQSAVRSAVSPVVSPVAVAAGRHRPVAAGTSVDMWWFITIITWFTRSEDKENSHGVARPESHWWRQVAPRRSCSI